jgi:hypothetical protein
VYTPALADITDDFNMSRTAALAGIAVYTLDLGFGPIMSVPLQPVVFFLSLYTAFAFGMLFLFFAALPYIFMRPPYSFDTSQSASAICISIRI